MTYAPERGDVVWTSFDPLRGHEQAGHRPALVLSPRSYNVRRGLMICVPVTSRTKGYALEVPVECDGIRGVALADQLNTLDWRARRVRFAGSQVSAAERAARLIGALIGAS